MRTEGDALLSLQRFFAGVLPEPWDVRTELEAGDPPARPFALIEQSGPALTTGAPAMQEIAVPMTANLFLESRETRAGAQDAARELREDVWAAVKWGPDLRRPTTDRIPLYSYQPRLERHRFRVRDATGGTWSGTVDGTPVGPVAFDADAAVLAVMIEAALQADHPHLRPGDILGVDRGTGMIDVLYGGALAGVNLGAPTVDDSGLAGPSATATGVVMLQGTEAPWRGPSDYMRVDSFAQNTVPDEADAALLMVAVDLRLTFVRGRPLPLDVRILQRISATVGSGPEA